MKIVFFTTAHNSLSQRAFVELVDRGHTAIVVIASSEEVMLEAGRCGALWRKRGRLLA